MSTPFVGREAELQVLRAALADVRSGRGRLVLLAGEPGMGKTRTAEEFATIARQQGGRVLWGRCYEGEGAPAFWPWVQALRAAMKPLDADSLRAALGTDAVELAHLVPEIREQFPDLPSLEPSESPQARFRQFDSVTRFFGKLAQRGPLLVVLDDLHGADRSSLLLLEFMARALRDIPVLIVGTYREVGTRVEPALTETLVDLTREPTAERVVLAGLNAVEIAQLVQASAGVEPTAALVTLLHQRTEGNPLFVREFVRVLAAEGRLRGGDQVAAVGVPQNVEAVIERRLSPLSAACREVLDVAAVIGREFAFQVLLSVPLMIGTLSGDVAAQEASAVDALAEAEGAGLITRLPGSTRRYRFAHALFQETLYNSCGDRRRAQLHWHVGEALERLPDADAHLSELAYHFFEAGEDNGQRAISYARRAGDRAIAVLAFEEAVRLYQLALGLTERSGEAGAAGRCAVLVDLGIAQREACDLETSKATLLRAADLAKRLGLREELARAALHFGTKLLWGEQVIPDHALLQLLEEAAAAWGDTDSPLQARVLASLAAALLFSGEQERRSYVSRRAVEMARRLNDPTLVAETLHTWLVAHWRLANLDERVTVAREMAHRAEQTHAVDLVWLGNAWRWLTLIESGQLSAANALRDVFDRLFATFRDPLHRLWAVALRAALSIQEGRFAEAEVLLQEVLSLEQALSNGPAYFSFTLMLTLWFAQGRRDALETMLDSQRTALESMWPGARQSTIASIACELNRPAEARVEFEQLAARQFADVPYDGTWLMFMQRVAEVCAFLNDLPRAERLLELLSAYETRVVVSPVTKVYLGPVSQSLALLETTLSRWEDAIGHFEHALEKHREMRARPALARAQYEYGRMLLSRGEAHDQERAHTLLEEALATARDLDMPLLIERVEALQSVGDVSGAAEEKVNQPTPDTRQPTPESVFRNEGNYWTIEYAGTVARLKDSKGVQYLAHLLRHPGHEFLALDLVWEVSGVGSRVPGEDPTPGTRHLAPVLDAQAKAAYKLRLAELRDDLEDAEAMNDMGRAERVRAEIEFISQQVAAAVGLGGRDRTSGSDAERTTGPSHRVGPLEVAGYI